MIVTERSKTDIWPFIYFWMLWTLTGHNFKIISHTYDVRSERTLTVPNGYFDKHKITTVQGFPEIRPKVITPLKSLILTRFRSS
jgi:hypothetical protein